MRTQIKKWGNSAVVRIPKPYLRHCHLTEGSAIELTVTDNKIVVERVNDKQPEYALSQLLKQCKPAQMRRSPEDDAWLDDAPRGKEIL
jgi:antitoxin MazE